MKTAVFSSKAYDEQFLSEANTKAALELDFFPVRLGPKTAALITDHQAVCVFVNDLLTAGVLDTLFECGVRHVALRCAGFNNVDLPRAAKLGIRVARVPAYSPYAVAEFTLALILSLNRKTHRAYSRVRDGNFSIDGLLGFDLHNSTVGIVGTGKIGTVFARILHGFGATVLGHDPAEPPRFNEAGGSYVGWKELLTRSDILSLHCPLTPETFHCIDARSIAMMKPGVMLINTSRGGLIDSTAVIGGLKARKIGSLGLDVYEQEADVFYENLSETIIEDDVLQRLITFPNVLITSHQAYFTRTAMQNIADTTIANLVAMAAGKTLSTEITPDIPS